MADKGEFTFCKMIDVKFNPVQIGFCPINSFCTIAVKPDVIVESKQNMAVAPV